jgi:DNA-binding transcriptional ArsR family regulator
VPTDLDILRALHERRSAPVTASELAEASGMPFERVATRMKSLVSLRYVTCISDGGDALYALGPGGDALDGPAAIAQGQQGQTGGAPGLVGSPVANATTSR